MKKYYLVLTAFCALSSALAQSPAKVSPAIGDGGAPQKAPEKVKTEILVAGPVVAAPTKNPIGKVSNRGNVNYSANIRIGSSYYDLQSNYSMAHRLVLHPDGSVSAAWTTSPDEQQNFPNRGTGFNFANSSGSWGAADSNRVEGTVRTGWPNIGLLSNGNEFVIGHEANAGGFYISKAATKGARPTNPTLILQEIPFKPIWSRAANNGDTIHMVYSYSDSAVAGDQPAPVRNGVRAPMVYSRSLNGGTTWDIQHIMLPGYDTTLTYGGGSDQYAIDCDGNNVVIVNADHVQGVVAWRSSDFGTNWTKIVVDTFDYAPWSTSKMMLDTPFTCDGTADVILDKNGTMHVFWGLSRVYFDGSSTSWLFYPGYQGLVYWNDDTKLTQIIAGGNQFDRDGDGVNSMLEATTAALDGGNLPASRINPGNLSTVARLTGTNVLRQPNAAVDENGNLYCIFSIPIEGDVSELEANYRDIGVVFSEDGGANWSTPQNLTQAEGKEDDFACVVRRSNGFLHMMWQQDRLPGTNLQNNSSSDGNHQPELNSILYHAVPVADILDGTIGMMWELGIDEPNTGEVRVVSQNYPNPFSGSTNVVIDLNRPGKLEIVIRNSTGAIVRTSVIDGLSRGNHIIEIDGSDLASGIYTYSLTSGGSTVTNTMMVK